MVRQSNIDVQSFHFAYANRIVILGCNRTNVRQNLFIWNPTQRLSSLWESKKKKKEERRNERKKNPIVFYLSRKAPERLRKMFAYANRTVILGCNRTNVRQNPFDKKSIYVEPNAKAIIIMGIKIFYCHSHVVCVCELCCVRVSCAVCGCLSEEVVMCNKKNGQAQIISNLAVLFFKFILLSITQTLFRFFFFFFSFMKKKKIESTEKQKCIFLGGVE